MTLMAQRLNWRAAEEIAMNLHFRPENAHRVPFGERQVLVAAKSMSLFVLDP